MKPTITVNFRAQHRAISLLFLIFSVTLPLAGCTATNNKLHTTDTQTNQINTNSSNNSLKSLENIKTFRGLYIYGHEVRSFTPCNSDKEYWALDNTNGDIVAVYSRLTHKPYSPIFVEVQGILSQAPLDGFGADYDETLTIQKLTHASSAQEGWGCREKYGEFTFKAQGNEPGWTILISPDQIKFSSINFETPLLFPASPSQELNGSITYKSTKDGHTASITLSPIRSIDSMSGEVFGWKAEAEIDGTQYQGQAKRGDL